jgi:hypothetical protein
MREKLLELRTMEDLELMVVVVATRKSGFEEMRWCAHGKFFSRLLNFSSTLAIPSMILGG